MNKYLFEKWCVAGKYKGILVWKNEEKSIKWVGIVGLLSSKIMRISERFELTDEGIDALKMPKEFYGK